MAKKLIIVLIIGMLVALVVICHLSTGATEEVFGGIVSQEELSLSLASLGITTGSPLDVQGDIQNGRILVFFGAKENKEAIEPWRDNGYTVLRFDSEKYDLSETELFVAAYSDCLQAEKDMKLEIRFLGEGSAARLSLGAVSYLIDKAELYPGMIPERVTLCELRDAPQTELENLGKRGVAVELVGKSNTVSSDWTTNLVFGSSANYSLAGWYSSTLYSEDGIPDSTMNNTAELAPTAIAPTAYILARRGTAYNVIHGAETPTPNDDVISSTNINSAIVSGIVYDAESNINLSALPNRIPNARVELYLVWGAINELMGIEITDKSGMYKFDIPKKYTNGFDEFFIVVYPPVGYYTLGESTSPIFVFPHMKSSQIINIGVVEK